LGVAFGLYFLKGFKNISMRPITSQDLVDIREHFPLDSCLLPPDLTVTPEAARAFDRLYDAACAQGPAAQIAYDLPYPKYLFLEYLSVTRGLLFHGSNNRAIDVLRPIRFSTDSSEFGSQDAVYASQDPLWAMYFAVLDRSKIRGTSNGAIRLLHQDGAEIRRYYFATSVDELRSHPWTPGALYMLTAEGFEPDPEMHGVTIGPYSVVVTHWIYRGELAPLARLNVEPQDFPYLDQHWGYDPVAFNLRMDAESLAGFPFLDDPQIYPIIPRR
jgi:hypothetical protein